MKKITIALFLLAILAFSKATSSQEESSPDVKVNSLNENGEVVQDINSEADLENMIKKLQDQLSGLAMDDDMLKLIDGMDEDFAIIQEGMMG